MNILLGLAVGVPFGVVLDRGQFCMNRALHEATREQKPALLRAYLLALALQMVGVNLLATAGMIRLPQLPFSWAAAALGGIVFGWGMGWALG
jgi:hypothetical protein